MTFYSILTQKKIGMFPKQFAKRTSLKAVVYLKGNQSFGGSIRGHVKELNSNLEKFQKMRSDLQKKTQLKQIDPSQQRADVHRTSSKLKTIMFKSLMAEAGN